MRKLLLMGVAAVALIAAVPTRAQIPVTDFASIAQDAFNAATQLAQLVKEYQMLKQQYDGIMQTVGALSHPNQTAGIAQGLLQQQIQNPGSGASSIPGLAFGSQLSAYGQRFLSQNRYYAPQGNDFGALEMQRRAQVTANLQGEAQAGMDRADQRIAYLNQLQQSIDGQPDVQAVAAVHAQIGSEQTFLANEGNNVQRLQLLAQLSERVDQQRAQEAARKDADDWRANAGQVFTNGGIP